MKSWIDRRRLGVTLWSLALIVGPAMSLSHESLAQGVLSGVVKDSANNVPIAGALVRLNQASLTVTDSLGRFKFLGVNQGRQTITARALGHSPRDSLILFGRDTSITFRLPRAAVLLDTVHVHGTTVTIRGEIVDSVSGTNVLYGRAFVYPGGQEVGALSGRFLIESVPAGAYVAITAEGLEYLSKTIEISTSRDTTIRFRLAIDSVALRLIAEQVRRLSARTGSVPHSVDALGRRQIGQSGVMSIGELVKRRLPPNLVRDRWPYMENPCVFFDDKQVPFETLLGITPEVVERVEIFGRDGRMIRVYSRKYVADLSEISELPRLVYMGNGLSRVCH